MQGIEPPSLDQLRGAGQRPLLKVEIEVGADNWINLSALDAKNYVEGVNISLGGAGMTPDPIGGTLSVTLSNEASIFHPLHPTSGYEDYIKAGRKVKISIGAKYGVTDYYWERIIGHIDEPDFETLSFKVNISGGDYMKFLEDAEFKTVDGAGDPDNYWGVKAEFNSYASDGLSGVELYDEEDAMDIDDDNPNVTPWDDLHNATFESFAPGGTPPSNFAGKMVVTGLGGNYVRNDDAFTVELGKEYLLRFQYKKEVGTGNSGLRIVLRQWIGGVWKILPVIIRNLDSDSWTEGEFYFEPLADGAVMIELIVEEDAVDDEYWIDVISVQEFTPYDERYYELPEAAKGVHHVTLDGVDVWQGEEDEGWYYERSTRRVSFDINKTVGLGTDNVDIYYYTATAPEDAVARILFKAGLYASEAAALAAMDNAVPGFDIEEVWFEIGTPFIKAIRMLCEVCDYRFYFEYDGTPVFRPKPTPDGVDFAFTAQAHITSARNYQDRGEIWNRVIIEGKKQADPVDVVESRPSELRDEAFNQDSIDAYGERTLTIKNHLFQHQGRLSDMCDSLLAEYKDPKWYADIKVPFNPVPLELGDKITWLERLNPDDEITQTGMIRDIKIDTFSTTYKCEIV